MTPTNLATNFDFGLLKRFKGLSICSITPSFITTAVVASAKAPLGSGSHEQKLFPTLSALALILFSFELSMLDLKQIMVHPKVKPWAL